MSGRRLRIAGGVSKGTPPSALRDCLAELPAEALLPVYWVRALLDAESTKTPAPVPDLTVRSFAELVHRSPAQVRAWCAMGAVPNAYRLPGKKRPGAWRIPAASLAAFRERSGPTVTTIPEIPAVDIAAWRKVSRRNRHVA